MESCTSLNTDSGLYQSEGYCVFEDLLPADIMAGANASLQLMLDHLPEGRRPESLIEPHMLADDWQLWLQLCAHEKVLDAIQACLGCDEIVLLMSHLFVKPAGDGMAVAWHQDNTYWPSVNGTDVGTMWLAMDDVDVENACMNVIPKTHAGFEELAMIPSDSGVLAVHVDVSAEQEATAVPIELQLGGASVHDSFIIHGSEANLSNRRRSGFTLRYGNAATVEIDLAEHNKPVYYMRGDGSNLKKGYRDFRPGCTLPQDSGEASRHKSSEFEE
ncbi:MAG: phytanoyl-CoA dioxygenase family protein [Planctomycetes bacterium]|nr:phytanoyl-CoA dioxygenase family protein [Planctomycetota bacterium]